MSDVRCPSSYALRERRPKRVDNSAFDNRPSEDMESLELRITLSGSASSSPPSSSTSFVMDAGIAGSMEICTTRETWSRLCCAKDSGSPTNKEYAGSSGGKLKSVQGLDYSGATECMDPFTSRYDTWPIMKFPKLLECGDFTNQKTCLPVTNSRLEHIWGGGLTRLALS